MCNEGICPKCKKHVSCFKYQQSPLAWMHKLYQALESQTIFDSSKVSTCHLTNANKSLYWQIT